MERIIVNGVSKEFKIGVKTENALSRFIMLFSGNEPKKTIQVLNKVSFKVNEKEMLGIIGENGSGKSTMLRILAGIYKQDSGDVIKNGKIISLINLNVGLKDRLTMKDNIYLVGSFFGLTRKQIKDIFNDIVKFSELENFISTKIFQFSEGMKQRLAFSIAVHSNPEILLLDEVLSVGDEQFKVKSLDKIKELIKNGACGVFVSHDLESIRNHCRKALFLHKGEVILQGNSKKVIEEYLKGK
jgi:ABC-type polysaccharide/polyol phosphate transport system ATPase subunit